MLDKNYFENGHLKRLAFVSLENDMMTLREKELIISHINACEDCMNEYLSGIDETELLSPSDEFYESLNLSLKEEKQKATKNEWRKMRMQSVKLIIAACMTIVVFFGSGFLGDRNQEGALQSAPVPPRIEETKKETEVKQEKKIFDKLIDDFQKGFFDINTAIKAAFRKGESENGK